MRTLSTTRTTRWAPIDGETRMATTASGATAVVTSSATETTVTAAVAGGYASLAVADMVALVPAVGVATLEVAGEASVTVERVGGRYCTPADVVAYGAANDDGFDRFDEDAVASVIQQAEETIEAGCGRSFTRRAVIVTLRGDGLQELPVVDATGTSAGALATDRQVTWTGDAVEATVVYGGAPDAMVHEACMRLAASYLRPRAGAENARGTAVDGVYVSYDLATGEAGSWTGIPYVDSTIESHRSHRVVIG